MKNKYQLFAVIFLLFFLAACQKTEEQITETAADENRSGIVLDQPRPGQIAVIDSDLIITRPLSNEAAASPLTVAGRAKSGQGDIYLRLKDQTQETIVAGTAKVAAAGASWGNYRGTLEFRQNQIFSPGGTLEVYFLDNEGKEKNLIQLPVIFEDYQKIVARLYFGSLKQDPERLNCGRVYEATRELAPSRQILTLILNELFKGPTAAEAKDGFVSYLPKSDIKINKVDFKENILYLDFNQAVVKDVNACQKASIRAQIIETLKQFKDVKDAVVSVEGRVWL